MRRTKFITALTMPLALFLFLALLAGCGGQTPNSSTSQLDQYS